MAKIFFGKISDFLKSFRSYTINMRKSMGTQDGKTYKKIKRIDKENKSFFDVPPVYLSDASNWLATLRKRIFNFVTKLLIVFIVMSALSVTYILYFANVDPSGKDVLFTIPKNTNADIVAKELQKRNLIRNPFMFKIGVKMLGADKKIHAGIFELAPNMSITQIINKITEKTGSAKMVSFTIPEGYSLVEIGRVLEEKQLISAVEFIQYVNYGSAGQLADKFEFLDKNPIPSLEGYLFPDTYTVTLGLSAQDLVEIMLQRFDEKMYGFYKTNETKAPLIKKLNRNLTLHEMLTLASIIEKEAAVENEREFVADVFLNRLRFGMYMDSCPTVKYAMNNPRKPDLTLEDLDYKSPYNTYRNLGLPPGPICSPGLQSLIAVFYPSGTRYLYMIARGDGTHAFSFDLDGHNNLRAKLGYNRGLRRTTQDSQ